MQRLEFYQVDDLQHIVKRSAQYMGLDITEEGALQVAMRSRGPHVLPTACYVVYGISLK